MDIGGFQRLIDRLPEAIMLVDAGGRVKAFNSALCRLLRVPAAAIAGSQLSELTALSPERVRSVLRPCNRSPTPVRLGMQFHVGSTPLADIHTTGFLFSPASRETPAYLFLKLEKLVPQSSRFLMLNREIEKQHKAMRQLGRSRDELQRAKDDLKSYVDLVDRYIITSTTDAKGIIAYASEAFCKISKYSSEELIGRSHNIVRHPDMPESLYVDLWRTISSGRSWRGEIKNRAKDGSAYWVDVNIEPKFSEAGVILGYTSIRQDITDKKRIEELSVTDPLTKLFNRLKLDQEMQREIERASRYGESISVILFDIDHFKRINDEHGHIVGDAVLCAIARLTRQRIRQADTAGRWGGEEFMIICPQTGSSGARLLAEDLRLDIERAAFHPVKQVTASFGVARYRPGESNITLIHRVDQALYKAKADGRNRVVTIGNSGAPGRLEKQP